MSASDANIESPLVDDKPSYRTYRTCHRVVASALVLACGLVATALLWRVAQQDDTRRLQSRLDFRVQRICAAIQARMVGHEQVLRSGASWVAASGGVTRSQWREYVQHLQLERSFPGFQGVGWARYVPAQQREAFEHALRAEGLPDYAVRPEGERPGHGPVTYLEPNSERNLRAHGFDMLSEPVRRKAMERGRDSGEAAITGKLTLTSEAPVSGVNGFLMFVPVYGRPVGELRGAEQRRAALLGWVNSPFRIGDLLQGAVGPHREELNLRLYDGTEPRAEALMHDDGHLDEGLALAGLAPVTRTLQLPGHAWTLEFTPLQGLRDGAPRWLLPFIGLAGAGISMLLATLTWLLMGRVAQARREQARLRLVALTDPLTGLPNRMLLQQRLAEVVAQCVRTGTQGAVLFVDLDNFKFVNDSNGHHAGDAVLRVQARRLAGTVRAGDVVARLGGDEFCIVLRGAGDSMEAEAVRVAERVIAVVSDPVEVEGRIAQMGASVGIAMIPRDGADTAALLRRADTAMYRAKLGGKQRWCFFGEELDLAATRRAAAERLVREALRQGRLQLHYQPVVDLADGRTVAAEALLRLPQENTAQVSTGELVAVAEQCGLIGALGAWVLDAACAQLGAWQAEGACTLRLAVNVSARQFHDQGFVAQLRRALSTHRVDPAGLELELTETALLSDQAQVQRTMLELRELGVTLVLDDFGTGYSSLSHVRDFPVSKIKIDRRFVFAPDGGLADAGITRAIVALGHGMGAAVVAEGIETEAQRHALREQGCLLGQGWLFGAALPAQEFRRRFGTGWEASAAATRAGAFQPA